MKHLFFLFFSCLAIFTALSGDEMRIDYQAPLTEQEKTNIRFIILTLSHKSGIGLLFQKSALERAGDGVRDVHPLRFLCYVFTDPQLRLAVARIQGMAWSRFSKDMSESLARQAQANNLSKETLSNFAKEVGIKEPQFNNPSAQNLLRFIEKTRSEIAMKNNN